MIGVCICAFFVISCFFFRGWWVVGRWTEVVYLFLPLLVFYVCMVITYCIAEYGSTG